MNTVSTGFDLFGLMLERARAEEAQMVAAWEAADEPAREIATKLADHSNRLGGRILTGQDDNRRDQPSDWILVARELLLVEDRAGDGRGVSRREGS